MVALVHDYLLVMRGAERTFATMADCWPGAPIATLLYDPDGTEHRFAGRDVTTSPLQRLGVRQRGFRSLLPLFPYAVEHLNVPPAQLVVSSSSAFAHGIRPPAGAAHVCYCHSPFRYVYHEREQALAEAPRAARGPLAAVLSAVRRWEDRAAQRPTALIANSLITQRRIHDFWERDAPIVHPPVEVGRFEPAAAPGDYFLVVCELVRHKRVEIALEAAKLADAKVVVVGDGPDRERLETAYPDAEFAGRVSDAHLAELYARALALVVPNVEDFGIAPVEAQAAGRPVLALEEGGTGETVMAGETGVLVERQDARAFAEAMRHEDWLRFDGERIQRHAARFAPDEFKRKLLATVGRLSGVGGAAQEALDEPTTPLDSGNRG